MQSFISKLTRAGLGSTEAQLYAFIYNHPHCSVADACTGLKQSKSSVYRAFEELKNRGLIQISDRKWKQSVKAGPLRDLIQQLERRKRRDLKLIHYFKGLELGKAFCLKEKGDYIELLNEEETFEKYLDLSRMPWDALLAFGNWEDLNHEGRNLVPVEKQFVKNRLKSGGRAFVAVTKDGPYTGEIIDYESHLDRRENRRSKKAKTQLFKPFWVTAFEGKDYVHLWNLNEENKIESTLIHSSSVAHFYRDLIYSNVI